MHKTKVLDAYDDWELVIILFSSISDDYWNFYYISEH